MATTAVEKRRTRIDLSRLSGIGPLSPMSMLAGILVGFSTFAVLLSGAIAYLHHRGSELDFTEGWKDIGLRGGVLLGGLLLVSYLLAGYVAGRMAWRRGVAHGIGVFVGTAVIVGALILIVRAVTDSKDVKSITDALKSYGVPTTRDEWRDVGSFIPVACLGGMLLGSLLGGLLGERWYTKVSRKALDAEIDVRERQAAATAGDGHRASTASNGNGNGNGNGRRRADTLDELSKEELYQRAQEEDIPGRSQMSKDELKKALQKQH
jgi:hypothetical protein